LLLTRQEVTLQLTTARSANMKANGASIEKKELMQKNRKTQLSLGKKTLNDLYRVRVVHSNMDGENPMII
jgi:hypothetical protein